MNQCRRDHGSAFQAGLHATSSQTSAIASIGHEEGPTRLRTSNLVAQTSAIASIRHEEGPTRLRRPSKPARSRRSAMKQGQRGSEHATSSPKLAMKQGQRSSEHAASTPKPARPRRSAMKQGQRAQNKQPGRLNQRGRVYLSAVKRANDTQPNFRALSSCTNYGPHPTGASFSTPPASPPPPAPRAAPPPTTVTSIFSSVACSSAHQPARRYAQRSRPRREVGESS